MIRSIGGRYPLSGLQARGNTGEVWRALDRTTDRAVAVKLLNSHVDTDRRRAERLLRAHGMLRTLWHPSIASVLDVVVDDGIVGLVTDLVPGTDLRTRLANEGPLAPAEATEITATLAEALSAAHNAGVVHGDIKPSNVLLPLRGNGAVRLTDFSVALLLRAGQHGSMTSDVGAYTAPR